MIDLNKLIPTQNDIRNYDSVQQMLSKLEAGETLPPIIVKELDDGKLYIHDGMHRACALWLHGVRELPESGYILKQFTYNQFLETNLKVGWVTPLDLHTECRKSDLYYWKNAVAEIQRCVLNNEILVERFIRRHTDVYKETREVWSIEDVIKRGLKNEVSTCITI